MGKGKFAITNSKLKKLFLSVRKKREASALVRPGIVVRNVKNGIVSNNTIISTNGPLALVVEGDDITIENNTIINKKSNL